MKKTRVTAVSYLNTLPFVYGLRHAPAAADIDLSLDVPSLCARKMSDGKADIGLIPVGAIPSFDKDYRMMKHCIAADGEVSSVLLVSKVPMEKIKSIFLDSDSRTSVVLVRVLASQYWNITPDWINFDNNTDIGLPESMVVIGDKAFAYKTKYSYVWDLAKEWKNFTGLPFVFAAWIASKNVNSSLLEKVNTALEYGITHIDDAIKERLSAGPVDIDLSHYLNACIHFRLEEQYVKGMELFLDFIEKIK
jgi:chorismate dehydratase